MAHRFYHRRRRRISIMIPPHVSFAPRDAARLRRFDGHSRKQVKHGDLINDRRARHEKFAKKSANFASRASATWRMVAAASERVAIRRRRHAPLLAGSIKYFSGEALPNTLSRTPEARALLLMFGMHVHVAMASKQTTIDMRNMVRYFLPHSSHSPQSPFWMGRNTGLKSFRTRIPRFPRTRSSEELGVLERLRKFSSLLVKSTASTAGTRKLWDFAPIPSWHSRVPDVRRGHKVEEAVPSPLSRKPCREAAPLYPANG